MKYLNYALLLIIGCLFYLTNINGYEMDDTIEVYYLIAPLMASKYGYLLANFNAFHAGLGFVASRTNEQFTVDFYASPTIMASFFPTIVNNSAGTSGTSGSNSGSNSGGSLSGSGSSSGMPNSGSSSEHSSSEAPLPDLVWNSQGIVQYQESINNTYWTSRELMFKITGQQFKEYLCWIPQYNESYPYYNLFDVVDSQSGTIFIASSTCYDFVWSSFSTLYSLGGNMVTTIPPKRDFVSLQVTVEPDFILHPREYKNWREITEFYSKFVWNPDQSLPDFIGNLTTFLNGTFFLYVNQNYYNLTLPATNPVSISYDPQNLPYGTADPLAIGVNPQCIVNNNKSKFIGGGWIFIIILLCFTTVYLVGGILVNKFMFHKSGRELLPNQSFWYEFGGLIQDGGRFIKNKVTSTPTNREHESLL